MLGATPTLCVFDLDACLWDKEMYEMPEIPDAAKDAVRGDLNGRGEGVKGVMSGRYRISLHAGALLALQGHAVIGVEVSPLACERFFRDHKLPRDSVSAARGSGGVRRLHRAGLTTLVEGDLFALRPERAFAGGDAEVADAIAEGAGGGALDVIWDRAAHVAVEPELRQSYVATLDAMLQKGGRVLLVGLDYDDARAQGPPHR